jgi:ribosomal protein S18 acetylase RimI-like enzyme
VLKVFSHTDAEAKLLLPQVSKYTELANMMNLPFWIFAEDSNPLGVVTLGKEPIQLLAPIGTPIAIIDLVQKTPHPSGLKAFASQSLKLALEKGARIATVELLAEDKTAIVRFLETGFTVLGDSFIMSRQLDQEFTPQQSLQYTQVTKDELQKWLALTTKFLAGSEDVVVERRLKNLGHLPDHLLAMYYSMETFYFVSKDEQEIGILNFNPAAGRISNIGVDPLRRSQGHGRQIMLFGLHQLKAAGCPQAKLGVRVNNKPALNLYKSLGFEVTERRKLLIFENKND